MVGYSKNVSCEKGRLFETTKHSPNENVLRVFSSRASTGYLRTFHLERQSKYEISGVSICYRSFGL